MPSDRNGERGRGGAAAAGADADASRDEAATLRFLTARGHVGLAWLDGALVVERTLGSLASFIRPGEPITESLLVLVGLEDSLAAMRVGDADVTLPNVALFGAGGEIGDTRMDVTVLRQSDGYLVLLGRARATDLAEQMVEDEIRRRRIADEELSRVNRQLEEFAYVISHDLKAPMRALRYYGEDVREALGETPPATARAAAAAERMQSHARRMSNMLVGLLDYARLGRRHEAVETVDTAALVAEIAGAMVAGDEMKIVCVGDFPTLRTTPVPLDLVLRNLIDNALKHHDRRDGTVTISAETAADHVIFAVSDDGPGIPSEWHAAIFEPFRRIADDETTEASGIGLALVKRTVEIAGGRIDVVSDPAVRRGTTFRVTWPIG